MTKDEFMSYVDGIKNPLYTKYGAFLWYLANDVLTIGYLETICENMGFTTERAQLPETYTVYSKLLKDGKEIGIISNQGFPTIELYNRCRKYSKLIVKSKETIEPIKGVHRVLEWHTVKGKLHILAGGQTVIHFLPLNITDDEMVKFLTKTKLIDKVNDFKSKMEK
jgi:hypothetical protein